MEISLRSQVGIRVDPKNMEDLAGKLQKLLDDAPAYKEKIQAIRDKYIANFGHSGEVGGRYILNQLKTRQQAKKQKEQ